MGDRRRADRSGRVQSGHPRRGAARRNRIAGCSGRLCPCRAGGCRGPQPGEASGQARRRRGARRQCGCDHRDGLGSRRPPRRTHGTRAHRVRSRTDPPRRACPAADGHLELHGGDGDRGGPHLRRAVGSQRAAVCGGTRSRPDPRRDPVPRRRHHRRRVRPLVHQRAASWSGCVGLVCRGSRSVRGAHRGSPRGIAPLDRRVGRNGRYRDRIGRRNRPRAAASVRCGCGTPAIAGCGRCASSGRVASPTRVRRRPARPRSARRWSGRGSAAAGSDPVRDPGAPLRRRSRAGFPRSARRAPRAE